MNPAGTAARLVEARRSGRTIERLDPDLLPRSDDDAYAVQEETLRLLGAKVGGWKVGSADATADIIAAPLLAELVRPSPARFSATEASFRAVEAELALAIGHDVPGGAGADEVWAAVTGVHVAIELLDTRYADRSAQPAAALLADMQNNGGFAYGPANPVAAVDFLAAKASLSIGGREAKTAIGGNPAGHPKRLLAWLARHAASRGRALRRGDIVTTGSHTGLTVAPLGARVVVRFEGLGEAVLDLA
jgi:2-keto-4-pentenoate hydratase